MEGVYLICEDEDFSFWFVNMGDTLTFHCKHRGYMDRPLIRKIQFTLDNLIIELMGRGVKKLETWIESKDEASLKFAKFFGFRPTGFNIYVTRPNGMEHELTELHLLFPSED